MKILSIVAAPPGWFAEFSETTGDSIPEGAIFDRVIVWAVVEDDDMSQRVVGMSGCRERTLMPDDEVSNFVGYVFRP